jgi:hypothetical protein
MLCFQFYTVETRSTKIKSEISRQTLTARNTKLSNQKQEKAKYKKTHIIGYRSYIYIFIYIYTIITDRLCGLVIRVPGYRPSGPLFHSRRYQIFRVIVGLKRGPLSLVSINEELLERKVAAPV